MDFKDPLKTFEDAIVTKAPKKISVFDVFENELSKHIDIDFSKKTKEKIQYYNDSVPFIELETSQKEEEPTFSSLLPNFGKINRAYNKFKKLVDRKIGNRLETFYSLIKNESEKNNKKFREEIDNNIKEAVKYYSTGQPMIGGVVGSPNLKPHEVIEAVEWFNKRFIERFVGPFENQMLDSIGFSNDFNIMTWQIAIKATGNRNCSFFVSSFFQSDQAYHNISDFNGNFTDFEINSTSSQSGINISIKNNSNALELLFRRKY